MNLPQAIPLIKFAYLFIYLFILGINFFSHDDVRLHEN